MTPLTLSRKILTCLVTFSIFCIGDRSAQCDILRISSVLGVRELNVDNLLGSPQHEIAHQAVLFALSPDGWNLASFGGYDHRRGAPDWAGGTEWAIAGVPNQISDEWGYPLNILPTHLDNDRQLQFHTDDTVSRLLHDVGEPLGFGMISGLRSVALSGISWTESAVDEWGSYELLPEPNIIRDILRIESVLGTREKRIEGLDAMSQDEVAHQAVLFALSPEGWNLEAQGGFAHRRGVPEYTGGTEWAVAGVLAANSESWGYELNEITGTLGLPNERQLQFHTDDTIARLYHDVGEPLGFGVISGLRLKNVSQSPGTWADVGVAEWGRFQVVPEPHNWRLAAIGLLLASYPRSKRVRSMRTI